MVNSAEILNNNMACCIVCGHSVDKLFKNNTCSFACNASLTNRKLLSNNTHYFNKRTKKSIVCPNCNSPVLYDRFDIHKNICYYKSCKNCNAQIFGNKIFCNSSCANTYNNKLRIGIPHSESTIENISKGLKKHNLENPKILLDKICKSCGKPFTPKRLKSNNISYRNTCSDSCERHLDQKSGKLSAAKRQKRSKQEIQLYNLCKKYFEKVEHNKDIFDGWDVDLAINDKNLVMWNGPWHFAHMNIHKVSLSQIQNRDEIKINLFMNAGFNIFIYESRYFTPATAFDDLRTHIIV